MRGVDVMLCFLLFPYPCRYCVLEPSLNTIMVVIGLTSWMGWPGWSARKPLLRERDFVAAARLAGTRPFPHHGHAYPSQCTHPVLVSATLGIAGAILVESSLAFRARRPAAGSQLGNMLMEGKDVLEIAVVVIVSGACDPDYRLRIQSLGESLRDTLDPRLKR